MVTNLGEKKNWQRLWAHGLQEALGLRVGYDTAKILRCITIHFPSVSQSPIHIAQCEGGRAADKEVQDKEKEDFLNWRRAMAKVEEDEQVCPCGA